MTDKTNAKISALRSLFTVKDKLERAGLGYMGYSLVDVAKEVTESIVGDLVKSKDIID